MIYSLVRLEWKNKPNTSSYLFLDLGSTIHKLDHEEEEVLEWIGGVSE
jgi:hypothetical protein